MSQLTGHSSGYASPNHASRTPSSFSTKAHQASKGLSFKDAVASSESVSKLISQKSFPPHTAESKKPVEKPIEKTTQIKSDAPLENKTLALKTTIAEQIGLKRSSTMSHPDLFTHKTNALNHSDSRDSNRRGTLPIKGYLTTSHRLLTAGASPKESTSTSFRFSTETPTSESFIFKTEPSEKLSETPKEKTWKTPTATTNTQKSSKHDKVRNKSSGGVTSQYVRTKSEKSFHKNHVTTNFDFQGEESPERPVEVPEKPVYNKRSGSFSGPNSMRYDEKEVDVREKKKSGIEQDKEFDRHLEVEQLHEIQAQDRKTIKELQDQILQLRALFENSLASTKSSKNSLESKEFNYVLPISYSRSHDTFPATPPENEVEFLKNQNKHLLEKIETLTTENRLLKHTSQASNQYKEAAKRYRELAREKEQDCSRLEGEMTRLKVMFGESNIGSFVCGSLESAPEPNLMSVQPFPRADS